MGLRVVLPQYSERQAVRVESQTREPRVSGARVEPADQATVAARAGDTTALVRPRRAQRSVVDGHHER